MRLPFLTGFVSGAIIATAGTWLGFHSVSTMTKAPTDATPDLHETTREPLLLPDIHIEQIYPEAWALELLTHPLRVSFHHPDPQGGIHVGHHRFSETPFSLNDAESELASNVLRSLNAYQGLEETSGHAPPAPEAMLRFENEQQTVDLAIHFESGTFEYTLNGQSINLSPLKITLSPLGSRLLRKLFHQAQPPSR